jgi:predicted enzyme related to lactoylglutathione lyase
LIKMILTALFISISAFAAPKPPSIQYVGAISLQPSQDAKVLADWYQKFGVDLQSAGGMYWGSFETAAGPFAFAIHAKKADAPKVSSGSVSVVYRVNDYDSYISMVSARGLKPESVESDPTGKFAHFRDPDGNEVTIWGE